MSFKKNKYVIIRQVLSHEMCEFAFNYLCFKKKVFNWIENPLSGLSCNFHVGRPGDKNYGKNKLKDIYSEPFLSTHSFSIRGSVGFDMLMEKLRPRIQKEIKLELIPTYSYARIYTKGDCLPKHVDREECEISSTLSLGGNPWNLYLRGKDSTQNIKISLKMGDLVIYRGLEMLHWRNTFKKDLCFQLFFHYNDKNGPYGWKNKYAGRPFLGAPTMREGDTAELFKRSQYEKWVKEILKNAPERKHKK
jgi:hypothetical protein